jgi:hypothetical protein
MDMEWALLYESVVRLEGMKACSIQLGLHGIHYSSVGLPLIILCFSNQM